MSAGGPAADPDRVRGAAGLYARALSGGARSGGELIVGPAARFVTDLDAVYVPWPEHVLSRAHARGLMTAVALQASPTKELVARIPTTELSRRQRSALQLAEGALALGWLVDTWPGLAPLAAELTALAPEPWRDIDPADLAERALRFAFSAPGRGELHVPPILGDLPVRPAVADGLGQLARRAQSRLPFSVERQIERVRSLVSIPVGGSGGEQAPANGVPEGGEPPDFGPATGVGLTYDEWDVYRNDYRRDFVTVLERHPPLTRAARPRPDPQLESWFALPLERRWQHHMEDGSDLDIDAIIAARADELSGHPRPVGAYRERIAVDRDAAFALLIDTSGSLAQGTLLQHELRCADALVAALGEAGGHFGVFAFWSDTRSHVVVDVLRPFGSRSHVPPSAAQLRPQGYTRLGAPIRHVTGRLTRTPARRRALLVLTDGLPCDDGYEGAYACHDVAKAIAEAELAGVAVSVLGVAHVDEDPLADLLGDRLRRILDAEDLEQAVAEVHGRLLIA